MTQRGGILIAVKSPATTYALLPSSGRFTHYYLDLAAPKQSLPSTTDVMEANLAALAKYQISNFFTKNAPATQEECNREAERITDKAVYITSLQGGDSYTVVSNDKLRIVQFRAGYCPRYGFSRMH